MEIIGELFKSVFGLLSGTELFGVNLLIWLIAPAVIIIVINFIKGKK